MMWVGKIRSIGLFAILLCVLPFGVPLSATPVPVPSIAEDPAVKARLAVLDRWLQAQVAERELPGLSVGIVHDQELIWARSYGFADGEKRIPATPKTAYRIASLSKTFTATAIMLLRDSGKLQLDDPVSKHLAWFKPKSAFSDAPVITIRHLLTHTSGLPRESAASWYWNDMQFPSRDEMIEAFAKQEMVLAPETDLKYSNLALAIAGEIVEKVSGEPYAAYLERHVLGPLGMKQTRVLPTPDMPGLAVGYGKRVPGKRRSIQKFTDMKGLSACGNLASTVEDLARWASLQMREGPASGTQILKGSSLREMHRVQWLRPDWKGGQGIGFSVRRVNDEVRFGHGGAISGHKTSFEIAPEEKLAVIVLANEDDAHPSEIRDMVFTLVEPGIKKAAARQKESPAPSQAGWDRYIGTYEWHDDEVLVMALDGELALVDVTDGDPFAERIRLTPAGPNLFKMKGGGTDGEFLRFEVDAGGVVLRMLTADSYYLPKVQSR